MLPFLGFQTAGQMHSNNAQERRNKSYQTSEKSLFFMSAIIKHKIFLSVITNDIGSVVK